jgi:hypothetical protein
MAVEECDLFLFVLCGSGHHQGASLIRHARQKRVEDARERAYTPASISFEKSLYKARWIAGSSPAMTPPANPR